MDERYPASIQRVFLLAGESFFILLEEESFKAMITTKRPTTAKQDEVSLWLLKQGYLISTKCVLQ